MTSENRHKRALVAYCALAERLSKRGMDIMQAIIPFIAEACSPLAGQLFEAKSFSSAIAGRYGFQVPRLAALGLAELLAHEGVLTEISKTRDSTVYRFSDKLPDVDGASPVTETEIELVLTTFVTYCRTDERLKEKDDQVLHAALLDRLLNADSMHILSRREATIVTKKTASTISRPEIQGAQEDRDEIHLDFAVSKFLLNLRDSNQAAFSRLSDIAFADMAAEAISCFNEPEAEADSLQGLTVYLDSPLLLDMLGVNVEYSEYGQELLQLIRQSGATAVLFDHCVAEAESAIHAQLTYLRSGVNQTAAHWGTTVMPDLLSALLGNVADRAEQRLGISVVRDPETNLHKRAPQTVGNIDAVMDERMKAWKNEEAKEYDRKSVWSLISLRKIDYSCARICDSGHILLTRNTALVKIANDAWKTWLGGATKFSRAQIDRWPPLAMSDKQFAGYLWARGGQADTSISRTRLLAHCSAAVRPRADVKARAINLMLQLHGRAEAEDIMALLEDREAARALMIATRGDPEDVTKERLPFILEKVTLAAGEFAAAKVREEGEKHLDEVEAEYEKKMALLQAEAEKTQSELSQKISQKSKEALQHELDKAYHIKRAEALAADLAEKKAIEDARIRRVLDEGFKAGVALYTRWRWIIAVTFGCATAAVGLVGLENPIFATLLSGLLSFGAFWFVPAVLDRPLSYCAMHRLLTVVRYKDSSIEIPPVPPDFQNRSWGALAK
jgi:hypothetical protein